jgi:hypothetical protein
MKEKMRNRLKNKILIKTRLNTVLIGQEKNIRILFNFQLHFLNKASTLAVGIDSKTGTQTQDNGYVGN